MREGRRGVAVKRRIGVSGKERRISEEEHQTVLFSTQ